MSNLTVRLPQSNFARTQMCIPYIVVMFGLLTYYVPTEHGPKIAAFFFGLSFGLSAWLSTQTPTWISTEKTHRSVVHLCGSIAAGTMILHLGTMDGAPPFALCLLYPVGVLTLFISVLLQKTPCTNRVFKELVLFQSTIGIAQGLHYFTS